MAITVVLPNALRPFAGGLDRWPVDAGTVAEALAKLVERYPEMTSRVPSMTAALNQAAVFRGGVDIRKLQGLDTPLRDRDVLTLVVPAGDL